MQDIPQKELALVLDWTKQQLRDDSNPPWAWYQYMKLQETIEVIMGGAESTTPMESSRQSARHSGKHLQLLDPTCQQDISQHRPSDGTVQMPM